MSKDDKEVKKEELLEKQEARQLTEEELEQVTGGGVVVTGVEMFRKLLE
ncbi:MAG: bacteriocin [Eubacteriales bacterium]|nr:bacteriocin [Eubacteriales bacterium]